MALVHFHLSFCPFVFRLSSFVFRPLSLFLLWLFHPDGFASRFTLHASHFTLHVLPSPLGELEGAALHSFVFFHLLPHTN